VGFTAYALPHNSIIVLKSDTNRLNVLDLLPPYVYRTLVILQQLFLVNDTQKFDDAQRSQLRNNDRIHGRYVTETAQQLLKDFIQGDVR